MPLTFEYCQTAIAADCSNAKFRDDTADYGISGNPERDALAFKYLVYKMDVNGARTLLTLIAPLPVPVNISGQAVPADYVADLITFPTLADGWYQLINWNTIIWTSGASFTKETATGANNQSLVYNPVDTLFYQALTDNTNKPPELNPTDWAVIVDTEWEALIGNTTLINNPIHNDVVSCRTERKTAQLVSDEADKILCGECTTFKELEDFQILDVLLNAMLANNFTEQQFKSEKIALFIASKYSL